MWQAISDLPPLRSRLSKEDDSPEAWRQSIRELLRQLASMNGALNSAVVAQIKAAAAALCISKTGEAFTAWKKRPMWQQKWFYDGRLGGVCHHETRGHIKEDLWRYLFAASFANVNHRSPVLSDFPNDCCPII